jgi:hypothetical protein
MIQHGSKEHLAELMERLFLENKNKIDRVWMIESGGTELTKEEIEEVKVLVRECFQSLATAVWDLKP